MSVVMKIMKEGVFRNMYIYSRNLKTELNFLRLYQAGFVYREIFVQKNFFFFLNILIANLLIYIQKLFLIKMIQILI